MSKVIEAVVTALVPVVVGFIESRLTKAVDRETAMLLLADKLKLRAHAQAKLDARRKGRP